MPRILFCSPTTITPRLGAAKVYIEVAESFRRRGWEVTLVGPEDVAGETSHDRFTQAPRLRRYLQKQAASYEVVEFEHDALPYPRADFPSGPAFVARSVLLANNVVAARIPSIPTLRGRIGSLLKHRQRANHWRRVLDQCNSTMRAADLINVPNRHDRARLLEEGFPSEKMLVHPFGLFSERYAAFNAVPDRIPDPPIIAFVGTFDPRKGMKEFPRIVDGVLDRHSRATFRLVGTAGMVRTSEGVLAFFPRRLRTRIEVIAEFEPAELPKLLEECTLGIFPSHCEGFGFGVLEMLAAGLPVFAYDAPGPPEMLSPEYLSPTGDAYALAERVCHLLADPDRLRSARRWARLRAGDFNWDRIISDTSNDYLAWLGRRRNSKVSGPAL